MSAFLSATLGGLLCVCGGIRALPSCFVLRASPFGVLAFALASALCLRTSSVAPVRGGTYF
ncbi:hypothetical protein, partial [Paraburkholderia hospita]|uniref:hypothetical protein n=1 Tax=Paraburkholderia hospita TaxID=169430 RepID=UPI001A97E1B7